MNRGAGGGLRLPVLVVVGTRPEAIKLVPIILALRDSASFVPVDIGTGQHHAMGQRHPELPIADAPAARPAGPS